MSFIVELNNALLLSFYWNLEFLSGFEYYLFIIRVMVIFLDLDPVLAFYLILWILLVLKISELYIFFSS